MRGTGGPLGGAPVTAYLSAPTKESHMRKTFALGLVAAVSAASMAFAVPAGASQDANCFAYLEESQDFDFQVITVDLANLKVTINPNGAAADVAMLRAELEQILGIFLCLEGGTVTGLADCVLAKVDEIVSSLDPTNLNLRYVYRDPATGNVTVDGGLLVADATACVP